MFFYFSITIFCALCMYCVQHRIRRNKQTEIGIFLIRKNKMFYYLPFFPLFVISALRYGIGTDYFFTYQPVFYRIRNGYALDHVMEPGYLFINKIVATFSDDVTWVIAIFSFFFLFFIAKAIMEQSDNPTISLLLLVGTGLYSFSMNGMRQALVVAIWFYAIRYIKEQKFVPYLIWMLISCLFHMSGLLLIPLYYVFTKVKIRPRIVLMSVFSAAVFTKLFKYFIIYISRFTKYYDKFSGTSQFEGDFAYSTFGVLFGILIYLLIIYKSQNKKWDYNFLLLLTTIGSALALITREMYVVARLLVFFEYGAFLYLPSTFSAFSKKSRTIIALIWVVGFFAYIWLMADYLGQGQTVPYRSIFSR